MTCGFDSHLRYLPCCEKFSDTAFFSATVCAGNGFSRKNRESGEESGTAAATVSERTGNGAEEYRNQDFCIHLVIAVLTR